MRKILYWVNVVLGLWIAASPWALNFRTVEPAFYSSLIAGLAVAAFAFASWIAEENVFKTGEQRAGRTGSLQAA